MERITKTLGQSFEIDDQHYTITRITIDWIQVVNEEEIIEEIFAGKPSKLGTSAISCRWLATNTIELLITSFAPTAQCA